MAKPPSLQQKIRVEIERKILSGAWAPGFRIPVEHELTARYGCSRMTVSHALSSLVQAGLLVRRKRGGSFVAAGKNVGYYTEADVTAAARVFTGWNLSPTGAAVRHSVQIGRPHSEHERPVSRSGWR